MAVRLLDELHPLERLALIDISYSRLSTVERCPAKYFYSYVTQEERLFSAPATLGKMVHSVLEVVDWAEPLNHMELHKTLEIVRPQHDPDGQVANDLIEAGHHMLSEFYDRHEGEIVDVLATELPFCVVVGAGMVSGYIDRVERTSQGIYFSDWKTGRWEVAQKNIAADLQLGIYALALSMLYPDEAIYGELYYLRSGRRKGHHFTRQDLDRIEQELTEKIHQLIVTPSFQFTDNARECHMCDFARSVCPVGRKRVRSQ